MIAVATIEGAREALTSLPRPLGFVPTMGALHDGHLQLVRSARDTCASVAASVFVNPLQFAPGEDFERYPRDPQGDATKLEAGGVDVLFAPPAHVLYPPGFSTGIDLGPICTAYEGRIRPGHFRGVATVVAKLLNIVQPDVLYVGQKDAQQTAVLRKLVAELAFPVRVHVVPTVREPDGLALSSRNVYLDARQRAAAPTLHVALRAMLEALRAGEPVAVARERALSVLHPLAHVEYLDVVNADTFEPVERLAPPVFVVGAARFGSTRLLDNLWVTA
ncbi:MAG TPA: pantoate--beta-alanine ligase [Candidatus Baltobacteraceae bacterium]